MIIFERMESRLHDDRTYVTSFRLCYYARKNINSKNIGKTYDQVSVVAGEETTPITTLTSNLSLG